ncbi:hypothetical protein [Parasitella parasitica]|nr:hypothetical protein [Parasitella parasitica]
MDDFDAVFPTTDTRQGHSSSEQSCSIEHMHALLIEEASNAADPDSLPFNESLKAVYETICDRALEDVTRDGTRPNVYFIDGPGGTLARPTV